MINFNLTIDNPFTDRWRTLFFRNGLLFGHKAWEFNGYATHQLVELELRLNRKCDHAGLHMMIGLLGYALEFSIYDTRHWDYDRNEYS